MIGGYGISCDIVLRWLSVGVTENKSALVQVLAWCRQAPSHYLSQYWHRSMSPYGVTRPLWVKGGRLEDIKLTTWQIVFSKSAACKRLPRARCGMHGLDFKILSTEGPHLTIWTHGCDFNYNIHAVIFLNGPSGCGLFVYFAMRSSD